MRQEDSHEFKVSLGYLVRYRPNWTRGEETVSAHRIQGGDPEVSDSAPSSCNPHHPRLAQKQPSLRCFILHRFYVTLRTPRFFVFICILL